MPMTQRLILQAMVRGGWIAVDHINQPRSSARRMFRLMPANVSLRETQVQQLLTDRLIRPQADGLFADGPPQSYVLFRASEGGA